MRKILTLVLLVVVAMSVSGCYPAIAMMMGMSHELMHGRGDYYGGWSSKDRFERGHFKDDKYDGDFWFEENFEDVGDHMVASAKLTAHFVAAAIVAGMTTDEINAVLAEVADESAISEFWVTDEEGNVVYANNAEIDFKFPTDPDGDSQAAPFAALLNGEETVVVQDMQPRASDGMMFRYVGVVGVDQARIVQVGVEGEEYWDE